MESKKTKRIVVVEDSAIQAEALKRILAKKGFEVSVAKNGIEGLEKIKESLPDLVVSDILMPEMDGFEMCKQIKENEDWKAIPVILLTSLEDPKDIVRGLECVATDFMTKPYQEEMLFDKIEKIFAKNPEDPSNEIYFEGQKYTISAKKEQILDFLISIYEAAVNKNKELFQAQEQLREMNDQLEQKIKERTLSLLEEIEERKKIQKENSLLIEQLQESLAKVKTLSGLLPICSYCKKIRDDRGYWNHLESYISAHSDTSFTHSMCPECSAKAYEELRNFKKAQSKMKE